jgi:CubicO group peptidase (beta-lactamase class C family)
MKIVLLLFLLFSSIFGDSVSPKRDYWPTLDWKTKTPKELGFNESKLNEALEYAFLRTGDEQNRKGNRTDSVVVIKNGYLVLEKYARGFDKNTPHLSWSVAKSFINTLYGIAEKEGILNRKDFAYKYFSELDSEQKKEITLEHLLNMSSGLDWNEGYEASPLNSTVIQMLYTLGKKDMAKYTADRPLKYKPGTYLYYSSGDSNLLMGILKNILKEKYTNYPKEKLFDKIGMKNVFFEKDSSGTFIGSSYIYATPRDYAKFGFLYLNQGKWENEKLFSDEWMSFTKTLAPAFEQTENYKGLKDHFLSAQWYVNTGMKSRKFPKMWENAPEDTLVSSGHWGQKIWVIPSLDLVVCIFADHRDSSFDENKFLDLILGGIKK